MCLYKGLVGPYVARLLPAPFQNSSLYKLFYYINLLSFQGMFYTLIITQISFTHAPHIFIDCIIHITKILKALKIGV